jgi:hypothetical protein
MRNMPKKTFTAEQIISELREVEVLISHIVPMSCGRGNRLCGLQGHRGER